MVLDQFLNCRGGWMLKKLWAFSIPFSMWLLASVMWAWPAGQSDSQVFTGEIMDSLCAKDGSHDKMMDEMKSMGRDKATCTQKCIQLGAKYVLFDPVKKTVFTLDDQDKAAAFAGRKVQVKGTMDKKKIKVTAIESAD
jgi:hypothetical protein